MQPSDFFADLRTNSQSMHRMMLMQNSWVEISTQVILTNDWQLQTAMLIFCLSSAAWGSRRSSFKNAF